MKKFAYIFVMVLLSVTTVVNLVFFARDAFLVSTSDLPEGKLLFSTMSTDPYQTYTVQIFQTKDENGIGDSVKAVRINNADKSSKVIYWQVNETNALVSWESDYVVVINDVALDVRTQSYDWRFPKVVEAK